MAKSQVNPLLSPQTSQLANLITAFTWTCLHLLARFNCIPKCFIFNCPNIHMLVTFSMKKGYTCIRRGAWYSDIDEYTGHWAMYTFCYSRFKK